MCIRDSSILASVLGLLSVLMLFVEKDISTGIAGLLMSFAISPFGLPALAGWLLALSLIHILQSRNERMFLLTFLIVNTAPTRERLENDIFTVKDVYKRQELDRMGDRRTATFFCISDTDSTYNFLVSLAFSQMFNLCLLYTSRCV